MIVLGWSWNANLTKHICRINCGVFLFFLNKKLSLHSQFLIKTHCVYPWSLINGLNAFSFLIKHSKSQFSEDFEIYIVYIHICLLAVFSIAFVCTLLHLMATVLLTSGIALNHQQDWVSTNIITITMLKTFCCLISGDTSVLLEDEHTKHEKWGCHMMYRLYNPLRQICHLWYWAIQIQLTWLQV